MARKVKLDILENREARIDEKPEEIVREPVAEVSDNPRPPTVRTGRKWILTGAVAMSVCLIAVGTVLFLMGTRKNQIVPLPVKPPSAALIDTIQPVRSNFDTFVVDCRDGAGKVRIIMFAFAVELSKPLIGVAIEDRAELRGAIYALSKKKGAASFLSPEERKGLKNEIAAELERQLGAGIVKAVYFTKFCVL